MINTTPMSVEVERSWTVRVELDQYVTYERRPESVVSLCVSTLISRVPRSNDRDQFGTYNCRN